MRRAVVRGRQLIDSGSGSPLQLHGLNVFLDYLRFDDMALMRQLLPSANVVRLVGLFWMDNRNVADCSCCTDDPSEGYLARACLDSLKRALITITSRGVWVIVAAKARYAAGEGWPEVNDVFHDAQLAHRYRSMWRHVARQLRSMPMLAGFEPMSEPRNKHIPQSVVRTFYEGVCEAIGQVMPRCLWHCLGKGLPHVCAYGARVDTCMRACPMYCYNAPSWMHGCVPNVPMPYPNRRWTRACRVSSAQRRITRCTRRVNITTWLYPMPPNLASHRLPLRYLTSPRCGSSTLQCCSRRLAVCPCPTLCTRLTSSNHGTT